MSKLEPPLPLSWTPELVQKFWDMFALSPLTFMSFGKQISRNLLNIIQRFLPENARILDFGGGDGDIAEVLLQAGYAVAIYDSSPERSNNALSKLHSYDNFFGYIQSPIEHEAKFDVVLCFEVLEHILEQDVPLAMKNITHLLKRDGIFIGTVPNNENLLSRQCICPQCGVMFHRWQHVRSFDEKSLHNFLQLHGLDDIKLSTADIPNCIFFQARPKGNDNANFS